MDKVRTILLYGADFNTNNKCLGRDMMQKVEKGMVLSEDQYKIRKRKAAILYALNKRLTFGIFCSDLQVS